MLPALALIIGMYVITRCISFLTRKETRQESATVKAFSVITIFITVLCIYDILTTGIKSGQ